VKYKLTINGYLDPGERSEIFFKTLGGAKLYAKAHKLPRYTIWEWRGENWFNVWTSHRY